MANNTYKTLYGELIDIEEEQTERKHEYMFCPECNLEAQFVSFVVLEDGTTRRAHWKHKGNTARLLHPDCSHLSNPISKKTKEVIEKHKVNPEKVKKIVETMSREDLKDTVYQLMVRDQLDYYKRNTHYVERNKELEQIISGKDVKIWGLEIDVETAKEKMAELEREHHEETKQMNSEMEKYSKLKYNTFEVHGNPFTLSELMDQLEEAS